VSDDQKYDWNARWRAKAADADWQADPWLLRVLPLLHPGRTLDVACGSGRNAIFLAEHGFAVTAIDLAQEALELLGQEAARRSLAIETRRVDLEANPLLPAGPFDLVTGFFYLHRPLLPLLRELVRPGGLMVLRTFSRAGPFPGGPGNPDFVLNPGELLEIFRDWEILLHEEGLEPAKKGGSLAGIVARRPAALASRGGTMRSNQLRID
jgi:tellurite methyltransferase